MRSVHLHIDQLVLHGVSAADQARIVRTIEAELGRLLSDPAFMAQHGQATGVPHSHQTITNHITQAVQRSLR